LLAKYEELVNNRQYEEAEKFKSKLSSMIVKRTSASPDDAMLHAKKLRCSKRFVEALAFLDAAAALAANLQSKHEGLETVKLCIQEMMVCSEIMVANETSTKELVKLHIILIMQEKVKEMKTSCGAEDKWCILQVATALHYIEWCQRVVGQWKKREATLKEAISMVRNAFGDDQQGEHSLLLGTLLHNLGLVCERDSRIVEAGSWYQQAAQAHAKFRKTLFLHQRAVQAKQQNDAANDDQV